MNMKRMRGRNHRGGSGGMGGGGGPVRHQSGNVPLNRNHIFDSSGPDLRVRGTSQQLSEKYLQLGRDATSSGDRVMAESYFQHAEHYFRILNAMNQAAQAQGQNQPQNQSQPQGGQGGRRQPYESQNEAGDPRGEPHGEAMQHDPRDTDPRYTDVRDTDDEPGADRDAGEPRSSEAREIPITAAPPEQ